MLSSFNSGKYLTATYEREREACAHDKARYTVAEQAYYEISGQSPGMGDRDQIEESFLIDTSPIDPLTDPVEIDIRSVRRELG